MNIAVRLRGPIRLHIAGHFLIGCAAALLAACGGGGSSSAPASTILPTGAGSYVDEVAYRSGALSSLTASAVTESAAVRAHQLTYAGSGTTVSFMTTTGHLTASNVSGNPEASMFYVAYTAQNRDGSPRPLTFFYNGGPGSSSIWLQLGSFAPKRVATPDPLTTGWPDFPLVDNQESLIDTTDLVFIDPPGTGFSEAIAPNTNSTFWGVDSDAAVMRDFILRYIAVNQRAASPIYLYGESYGTPRTDVLAALLEQAGVSLGGIVLQSCILDYNDQFFTSTDSGRSSDYLAALLPSYAAVSAYYGQVSPAPPSLPDFMQQMRDFATNDYSQLAPYGPTMAGLASPPLYPGSAQYTQWGQATGLSQHALDSYFGPGDLFRDLVSGDTIGQYDGRVSAKDGSAMLAHDPDPSDALISQPFPAIFGQQLLPDYLAYAAPQASYITLNDTANLMWDYTHNGESLPDTIPDLLEAITLNPQLNVLVENGYDDLVTPFFITEKDLGRLKGVPNLQADLQVTHYAGGHMIYLDDTSRPLMKSDLGSYYGGASIANAMTLATLPDPWPDLSPAVVAATKTAPLASVPAPARSRGGVEGPFVPAVRIATPPKAASGAALQAVAMAQLRAVFRSAAVNGSGSLTREQARAAGLGFVVEHFDSIDTRGTGTIRFAELESYLHSRQRRP